MSSEATRDDDAGVTGPQGNGDAEAIDPEALDPKTVTPARGGRIDGRIGCALTFVAGLGCLGLAWFLMHRKTGPQLDATTQLARIVEAAENADGTQALRDSGCTRAAVMPTEMLREVGQRLENERATKEKREPKDVVLGTQRAAIVCASATKSCRDVALTYKGAVKNAALPFVTMVEGPKGPLCTEEFRGDPDAMKPVGPLLLPAIFPAGDP